MVKKTNNFAKMSRIYRRLGVTRKNTGYMNRLYQFCPCSYQISVEIKCITSNLKSGSELYRQSHRLLGISKLNGISFLALQYEGKEDGSLLCTWYSGKGLNRWNKDSKSLEYISIKITIDQRLACDVATVGMWLYCGK